MNNSGVKVKICGIKYPEEASDAVVGGAHALGFVFAESSRRVDISNAVKIIRELPPFISRVGVFVNERKEKVLEIAHSCALDTLQFHGDESTDYCLAFPGYKIIKSFPATSELDPEFVYSYPVHGILLDTVYKDRRGGGGKSFDWKMALPFARGPKPLILAGGLTCANIASAIQEVNPYAVDVSSGVETDGKKSREKIFKFIKNAVRGVNYE